MAGEKWIHKAIERPGSYRASVRRRYGKAGFTERGTIKPEIVARDREAPGRLGKQARLAHTLRGIRQ
jgi:hypothetical protein